MAKYKVVIAGGGFAGVKAALMLAKYHILDVTLIYNRPDFQYHPKLYENCHRRHERRVQYPDLRNLRQVAT